jgi:hypothetical protein
VADVPVCVRCVDSDPRRGVNRRCGAGAGMQEPRPTRPALLRRELQGRRLPHHLHQPAVSDLVVRLRVRTSPRPGQEDQGLFLRPRIPALDAERVRRRTPLLPDHLQADLEGRARHRWKAPARRTTGRRSKPRPSARPMCRRGSRRMRRVRKSEAERAPRPEPAGPRPRASSPLPPDVRDNRAFAAAAPPLNLRRLFAIRAPDLLAGKKAGTGAVRPQSQSRWAAPKSVLDQGYTDVFDL